MARIAGISTQTNSKGMVTKITIDLKKHPEAKAPLVAIGLMEENQFEQMVRNGSYTPIEEARVELLSFTKSLWK